MAIMIPAEAEVDSQREGERQVFAALRSQLDDSFTVFHSYDIIRRNREDRLIDGEIDFLILHQALGLLVLEVKGGALSLQDGRWLQNGTPLKQSPLEQAKSNKYAVMAFLEKKMGAMPPISTGHAVCFPGTMAGLSWLPAGMDGITAGGREMGRLGEWLQAVMTAYGQGQHRPLEEKLFRAVRRTIMTDFEIGVSLLDRIEQSQQKFFSLTEVQCSMLDMLLRFRRVRVEGCAGSGKTVMAIKKARRLAVDGNRVLLLCFNTLLARNLQASVADMADRITACTYHQLCVDTLQQAGRGPNLDGRSSTFWDVELPELFEAQLGLTPLKWDAVIVDEGQDFREDYWITVEGLVEPDGCFYIFYDPDQNLRETRLQIPALGEHPYMLTSNCRNSQAVFAAVNPLVANRLQSMEGVPAGRQLETLVEPDPRLRAKAVGKLLQRLVSEEGACTSQIVILGGHRLERSCLAGGRAGSFTVVEEGQAGPQQVPYFTYMKYKGLEREIVILLDVDDNDPRWSTCGQYAAMTRAAHALIVVRVR